MQEVTIEASTSEVSVVITDAVTSGADGVVVFVMVDVVVVKVIGVETAMLSDFGR